MTIARHSCGPDYQCQHNWDCFVQCGGSINHGFFFEAFPDTFLRGDSKISLADAEDKVWQKLKKHNACDLDHTDPANFDKRDYRNGVGFCIKCGLFRSKIFPPSEICVKCGANTYYTCDKNGGWWCEECSPTIPEELLSETQKMIRAVLCEPPLTDEELKEVFNTGLKEVIEHILKKA